jgi:hypothetical protein
MKKRIIMLMGIVVGLSMLMGACAPMKSAQNEVFMAPEASMDSDGFYEESVEEMEAPAAPREGFSAGSGEMANPVERMVIYNADLRIAVEDPESAMQSIIKLTEDAGGFVVSSNLSKTYVESGSLPRVYITVRVPSGRLDSIMESIKGLTPNPSEDVISENVSGQDVTAEYTDLQSRLRNLEAAEEALVKLMDEAKDPQDVLDIFGELTYYRGEIEIVKGRMKYLEESAALSAISVEIVAKQSLQPITIAGWEPKGTIKSAVEALINTGQFLADAAIWFGIFCLPFLIPLSIGVYFLVKVIRKRRAKKKAQKVEKIESSSETKE